MAYILKEKLLEDLCSECEMKSLCDEKTCRVYQLIKKASEVNTLVDWWDRYCDGCTYQSHRKINVLPKYTWLDVINDCRVTLEEIGSEYCADDCPNIKIGMFLIENIKSAYRTESRI